MVVTSCDVEMYVLKHGAVNMPLVHLEPYIGASTASLRTRKFAMSWFTELPCVENLTQLKRARKAEIRSDAWKKEPLTSSVTDMCSPASTTLLFTSLCRVAHSLHRANEELTH